MYSTYTCSSDFMQCISKLECVCPTEPLVILSSQSCLCTNQNCKVTVLRKDLDEHVGSLCRWRVLMCAYCNKPHSKCQEEVSYTKIFQSIKRQGENLKCCFTVWPFGQVFMQMRWENLRWLWTPGTILFFNLPKVASHPAYQNSIVRKNFTLPLLKYKGLKLKLRVFLAGHSVAMVTYSVTKIIPKC